MNRGITLFRLNRQTDAEQVLRSGLKIKEYSAAAHYYLGRLLLKMGRNEEAEKELAASITLGGDEFKETHRILAVIYLDQGDKKRGVEELETYLRLVPAASDAEELRAAIQQNRSSTAPAPSPSTKLSP